MSKCKKCKKGYTGDCMLTNDVCVFCHYKINAWDSNGVLITKKESHKRYVDMMKHIKRLKKDLHKKGKHISKFLP